MDLNYISDSTALHQANFLFLASNALGKVFSIPLNIWPHTTNLQIRRQPNIDNKDSKFQNYSEGNLHRAVCWHNMNRRGALPSDTVCCVLWITEHCHVTFPDGCYLQSGQGNGCTSSTRRGMVPTRTVVLHINGTRVRSRSAFPYYSLVDTMGVPRIALLLLVLSLPRCYAVSDAAASRRRRRLARLEAAASAGVESRQGWRRDYEFSSSEIHLMGLTIFQANYNSWACWANSLAAVRSTHTGHVSWRSCRSHHRQRHSQAPGYGGLGLGRATKILCSLYQF